MKVCIKVDPHHAESPVSLVLSVSSKHAQEPLGGCADASAKRDKDSVEAEAAAVSEPLGDRLSELAKSKELQQEEAVGCHPPKEGENSGGDVHQGRAPGSIHMVCENEFHQI